jgi:hypothetical protein
VRFQRIVNASGMRPVEDVDSELRLIAAIRRTYGELGGKGMSTGPADQLLEERLLITESF